MVSHFHIQVVFALLSGKVYVKSCALIHLCNLNLKSSETYTTISDMHYLHFGILMILVSSLCPVPPLHRIANDL